MNFTSSAPARQPVPEVPEHDLPIAPGPEETPQGSRISVAHLRLLWEHRRVCGFLASLLIAFLIPTRYESTARLMPPDSSQSGGLAMAVAALSGGAGGLGSIASDVLGVKGTSDIFVGILSSRTVQDKLIQQFDLKKLYGDRRMEDTRKDLAEHTGISLDRKSQNHRNHCDRPRAEARGSNRPGVRALKARSASLFVCATVLRSCRQEL